MPALVKIPPALLTSRLPLSSSSSARRHHRRHCCCTGWGYSYGYAPVTAPPGGRIGYGQVYLVWTSEDDRLLSLSPLSPSPRRGGDGRWCEPLGCPWSALLVFLPVQDRPCRHHLVCGNQDWMTTSHQRSCVPCRMFQGCRPGVTDVFVKWSSRLWQPSDFT